MKKKSEAKELAQELRLIRDEQTRRGREKFQHWDDEALEERRLYLVKACRKQGMREREGILEFPYRVGVMACQKRYLQKIDKTKRFGNYVLLDQGLPDKPIVYSAGVGGNIDFDKAVRDAWNAEVHLFDPTPRSISFMEKLGPQKGLTFHPWAVFTVDGPLDLYFDHAKTVKGVSNASATNIAGVSQRFRTRAYRLSSLMKKLGHNRIDILKLDIEGAAPTVLQQALEEGIYPRQIVAEFERPVGFHRTTMQMKYLLELRGVLRSLRKAGYAVHRTRKSPYQRQVEVLAIQKGRL